LTWSSEYLPTCTYTIAIRCPQSTNPSKPLTKHDRNTVAVALLEKGSPPVSEGEDAVLLETKTGAAAGPTIPVGEALLGRVVDPLGRPIHGLDPLSSSGKGKGKKAAAAAAAVPLDPQGIKGAAPLLHRPSPTIMARKPLCARLPTGVKALDVFHPLAHGQCFGLLGRRGSGKTALALQVIGNQRASGGGKVHCVYVAIGQVRSKRW
jgi:F0F1-type ATP synthase alpha subunit